MNADELRLLFSSIQHFTLKHYHITAKSVKVSLEDGQQMCFPIPAPPFVQEHHGSHQSNRLPGYYTEGFAPGPPSSTQNDSDQDSTAKATSVQAIAVAEAEPQVSESRSRSKVCCHSDDWRVVVWFGKRFELTVLQGEVVRQLWAVRHEDITEIQQEELLVNAGSDSMRLSDVFRNSKDAWGQLVCTDGGGRYRLTRADEISWGDQS